MFACYFGTDSKIKETLILKLDLFECFKLLELNWSFWNLVGIFGNKLELELSGIFGTHF